MSTELVFKKKVTVGEYKTVLDAYLLQVLKELVLDYSVAMQQPYAVFYLKCFFFHMAFLITSVNGLSGAFSLDDHSLLATILIASVGNTQ